MTQDKIIGPKFSRKTACKEAAKQQPQEQQERDDTVCVALNRPMGINFPMPNGQSVTINGNGTHLAGKEKGELPIGAYGLTIIKKSDWEYITKTYGGMRIFTEGLCFATRRKHDAQDEAESRDDLRNGLEPVDVSKTETKEAGAA